MLSALCACTIDRRPSAAASAAQPDLVALQEWYVDRLRLLRETLEDFGGSFAMTNAAAARTYAVLAAEDRKVVAAFIFPDQRFGR